MFMQTQVRMPVVVMGRMSQHFPELENFIPERWSREDKLPNMFPPYLQVRFGAHGCLGEG